MQSGVRETHLVHAAWRDAPLPSLSRLSETHGLVAASSPHCATVSLMWCYWGLILSEALMDRRSMYNFRRLPRAGDFFYALVQ